MVDVPGISEAAENQWLDEDAGEIGYTNSEHFIAKPQHITRTIFIKKASLRPVNRRQLQLLTGFLGPTDSVSIPLSEIYRGCPRCS